MPDKLTDNEIVKGLEICSNNGDCKECPINPHHGNYGYCTSLAIKAALGLINRLQAENTVLLGKIEGLEANRVELLENIEQLESVITQIKAEAYKECIEKVNNIINEIYNKHIFGSNDLSDEEKDAVINFSDDVTYALDNLLKELVGDGSGGCDA